MVAEKDQWQVLLSLLQSLMAPVRYTPTFWNEFAQHQLLQSSKLFSATQQPLSCVLYSFLFSYRMSKVSFHSSTRTKAAVKIIYNIKLKMHALSKTKMANKTSSSINVPFLLWHNLSYTRPAVILKKLLSVYWKSQTTYKECKKQTFTVFITVTNNYNKDYCMILLASTFL